MDRDVVLGSFALALLGIVMAVASRGRMRRSRS